MISGGSNDCKIVGFDVLVLARGGHASHFLVKTPTKKGGNDLDVPRGESEADAGRTQSGSY
jgi:hypothetical protein